MFWLFLLVFLVGLFVGGQVGIFVMCALNVLSEWMEESDDKIT